MIHVHVSLPSGHSEKLSIWKSSKVEDLRTLAEKCLGRRFVTLVTASGHVLHPAEQLEIAGIQDEDQLTALSQDAHLLATSGAFALWCPGHDRILTWGDQEASQEAFAALLATGSLVTWGHPSRGGDSSEVRHLLRSIKEVKATHGGFAASVVDGSSVTWGLFKMWQRVSATRLAFAAILPDGSVATLGDPACGGDSSEVTDQLKSVHQVQATDGAFAAILSDASVVSWGDPSRGGNSSEVQDQLIMDLL
eukprot:s74_g13.t1